jgi:hypothetical protein
VYRMRSKGVNPMSDDFDALSLFAMAELNQLRAQAFDLVDRCLAENNPAPIITFIERQLVGDPPHLPLLRDFADGLHQRLMTLRVNHYDVRNNVIKTLAEEYGVDITPLLPANAVLQYHELDVVKAIQFIKEKGKSISKKDSLLLEKLLEASIATASRLYREIQLLADLQGMVNDWLEALSATVGRRYWSESDNNSNSVVH